MAINVLKQQADPEIVEGLTELLQLARTGELVGYVATYELTGHRVGSRSNLRDCFVMLAHLTRQIHVCHKSLD